MKCTHARKLISAYLDGELGATTRERLASHLRDCEVCQAAFQHLQSVQKLFARTDRYEALPGLVQRIMTTVGQPRQSRFRLFPTPMRLAAQAMAFTAVMVVGVVSGTFLATTQTVKRGPSPAALYSLDVFAAAPQDSPGGVFLALLEASDE